MKSLLFTGCLVALSLFSFSSCSNSDGTDSFKESMDTNDDDKGQSDADGADPSDSLVIKE